MSDPSVITRDAANNLGVSALDMRQGLGALSAPATGNTFGTLSGIFPGGTSGSAISNDVQVFAASGMTVTVNGGHYAADRGSLGVYLGMVTGAVSVTHGSANVSNPRIDYVIIRTRDPGVDSGVSESARIVILPGSPAAVPTEPSNQMTSGDVLLAAVTIRANTSSVLQSDISDRRRFIAARGGIQPTNPNNANSDGSYSGDYRDNFATKGLERWSGSDWQQVASPAEWTAFTPALYSDAGVVNLGSSGSAFGRYMANGKIMHLRYEFRGVRPMNAGYGYISTRLPGTINSAALRESHILCKLNTVPVAGGGQSIWLGDCFIPNNSNIMYPYFPNSSGNCTLNAYRVAAQSGVAGASIPNVGNDFADPFLLTIQGTIEIQ